MNSIFDNMFIEFEYYVIVNYMLSFIIANVYYLFDLYMIGGVLFRPNEFNRLVFCPMNIINMIMAPLKLKQFWSTKLIFSNYFIIMLFAFIMYKIFNL